MYSPSNPQQRIELYPPILIGKHPTQDTYLASYGQSFVMLAAPPGTGKGVSAVVPNLLTFPDSVVVNDPKFENWIITSGFRAAAGHKVFRFSPEKMETHRWNPLSALNRDPLYRLGEIRTLAATLYVSENPKNQEWYSKAANVFSAILLYLMETPELPCTLPQAYEVASMGVGMGTWAEQVIALRSSGENALSAETLREMNGIVEQSKSKSGWSTTADITRSQLTLYSEKTVAWAVSGDDIDFGNAREEKTSIYFCVTDDAVKKFGPLMNLFFTQAIQQNSKVLPEYGGHCADGTLRLKYQLLFMLDEIAVMGRMAILETALALKRGAGLRFFIIFQNKDQMRSERTYGREDGDAIMNAVHIEIVFAPGDIDAAKSYSERLGNTTVRVRNDSVNHSKQGRNRTDSYQDQSRALLLPQEVNELPYDEQLIFVQGTKQTPPMNIRARKIVYYAEEAFKGRAKMPTPPVPVGDAALVDALTVPMRVTLPTAAMAAPHDLAIQQEQQKRTAPTDTQAPR